MRNAECGQYHHAVAGGSPAIGKPTRYRVVVLTSSRPVSGMTSKDIKLHRYKDILSFQGNACLTLRATLQ
jgi:hypothetical protein